MKTQKSRLSYISQSILFFLIIAATGCKTSDNEIKGDVATKAKADINFAGVKYTVKNGVVLLTGNCPSIESKKTVVKQIKNIKVVKGVVDRINIAPVVLDNNLVLKSSVDSVLQTYPSVQADVTQTGVILNGTAPKKDVDKLMSAITKLDPGRVQNNIKAL
jgi:hypothetical protein